MEALNNKADILCIPMPKDRKEAHIYSSPAVMAIDKSMFLQK